ncbi:MAG: DUF2867 domain-containing protein [Sulfurovum sp.]|nr:DUF2867 domain-containing protein [Sulfurovum sp.]
MKKIPLPSNMLVNTSLPQIDYSDCFMQHIDKEHFTSIDTFVKAYFESQPRWLVAISMNILSKSRMKKDLKDNHFSVNDNIGAWKIYIRDDKEIVFGDDMGFMEYRFSMQLDDTLLRCATVVQYKGQLGKYYFSFVKLLHQKFVLLSLSYPLKNH